MIPIVAAIAVRPGLWGIAVNELLVLARPGWWRRWPPLPLPAPEYLRFRLHTAYGDAIDRLEPSEVVDYLKWCRRMRSVA